MEQPRERWEDGRQVGVGANQDLSRQAASMVPEVWSLGEGLGLGLDPQRGSKGVWLGRKVFWLEVSRTEAVTAGTSLCPHPQPSQLHA